MKHTIPLLSALTSIAILFGCGTSEEQHAADHTHGVAPTHTNGGRWPANPETTEGIHGMQALAEGYPGNGLSSRLLRDSLDARMSMIFERCTMKGEAHGALHQYLLPLQDLIGRIQEEKSGAQLDSLRQHLRQYGELFY